MKKGKYRVRRTCRLCGSGELIELLDLGWMPLAGDYLLKKDLGKEKYYPLKIFYCRNCSLVQVLHVIDPDVLFKDYRYLSSIGLSEHFEDFAAEMVERFLGKNSFVVEIGSNDGVLLEPLVKRAVRALGIDPAENACSVAKDKGLDVIPDYFGAKSARRIYKKYGNADAVFANNVLAHIDDINDVFSGIKRLLKKKGVLVFEVHYLPELVDKLQYDFFYNEHLSYYSLHSLIPFLLKHDMEIFDARLIPIHSGSIRIYVKHMGNNSLGITDSFRNIFKKEKKLGFEKEDTIQKFVEGVKRNKKRLIEKLDFFLRKGLRVVGYGAAGRANTLLNYCEIDPKYLEYIVDESPERYGRYTPGTHIPIVKPEVFRANYPDYTLILAWNYKDMIVYKEREYIRQGGKFIVPLPKVRVIHPQL